MQDQAKKSEEQERTNVSGMSDKRHSRRDCQTSVQNMMVGASDAKSHFLSISRRFFKTRNFEAS